MTAIRIVIADHQPAVVAGLVCELGKHPALEVLGTARSVAGVIDILTTTPCDVLVTDAALSGERHGEGAWLIESLHRAFPDVRILALTTTHSPLVIRQMTDLGVASTVCKSRDIDEVAAAIHALYHGMLHKPASPNAAPDATPAADDSHRPRQVPRLAAIRTALLAPPPSTQTGSAKAPTKARTTLLSQRESQVLRLYVSGMSITAIAATLHRTKQTISAQKHNAMRKLGIDSDAQLYLFAMQTGLPDNLTPQGPATNTVPVPTLLSPPFAAASRGDA
ncbi:LuxR family transcriptional regulator [Pandoraea anapnoica]|uniref:LuxR family transcriptional regulator n=1 Tax=Pandoraea anapnoica TaxID=2508301 RepID=A0A5E4ZX29_9BURK|nr:response regulator transcription factor [Pandoraea anapnoica]VVE64500.1 LuxR family transcriptional regulator [Pandoraea anapnoica]